MEPCYTNVDLAGAGIMFPGAVSEPVNTITRQKRHILDCELVFVVPGTIHDTAKGEMNGGALCFSDQDVHDFLNLINADDAPLHGFRKDNLCLVCEGMRLCRIYFNGTRWLRGTADVPGVRTFLIFKR
ncbi:MAG: hypothetical protein HGB08_02435 [Candidatus Moranbacteria bacterium]|nr:hypothetical protein [Candidatus Moranbacteria bacterium]